MSFDAVSRHRQLQRAVVALVSDDEPSNVASPASLQDGFDGHLEVGGSAQIARTVQNRWSLYVVIVLFAFVMVFTFIVFVPLSNKPRGMF